MLFLEVRREACIPAPVFSPKFYRFWGIGRTGFKLCTYTVVGRRAVRNLKLDCDLKDNERRLMLSPVSTCAKLPTYEYELKAFCYVNAKSSRIPTSNHRFWGLRRQEILRMCWSRTSFYSTAPWVWKQSSSAKMMLSFEAKMVWLIWSRLFSYQK